MVIDNSICLFNRYLSYVDFVMIAGIIFVMKEQAGAGFLFILIISGVHDMLLFPYIGFTLLPRFLSMLFVKFMFDNLFRENYASKFFIMASGLMAKELLYAITVWVFYWNFRFYFFSGLNVARAALSVCFGMAAARLFSPGASIRPRIKKVFK